MKNKPIKQLSEEEIKLAREQTFKTLGLMAGLISKFMLQSAGCVVNYKINGEDISDIEKLCNLDITERIKLAVSEERYEDAAKLKNLLNER